jgi:hypothetical protein
VGIKPFMLLASVTFQDDGKNMFVSVKEEYLEKEDSSATYYILLAKKKK